MPYPTNLKQIANLVKTKRALLLDVRTKKEYCQGHLQGAHLISTPLPPLTRRESQMQSESLYYLLKDKKIHSNFPIYIYCKKGIRAKDAKNKLRRLGYKNVTVLGGVAVEPLNQLFQISSSYGKPWQIEKC